MPDQYPETTNRSNLRYSNLSDLRVLKVFYEFFEKNRISSGSICRKIQWLLFKLARITKCNWSATASATYMGEVSNRIFYGAVYFISDNGDRLKVDLELHNLKQFTHACAQIQTSFSDHSFIRRPYTDAQLLFELTDCKVMYETHLTTVKDNIVEATYHVEYQPLKFWEKVVSVVSSRHKSADQCVVISVNPPGASDAVN